MPKQNVETKSPSGYPYDTSKYVVIEVDVKRDPQTGKLTKNK